MDDRRTERELAPEKEEATGRRQLAPEREEATGRRENWHLRGRRRQEDGERIGT